MSTCSSVSSKYYPLGHLIEPILCADLPLIRRLSLESTRQYSELESLRMHSIYVTLKRAAEGLEHEERNHQDLLMCPGTDGAERAICRSITLTGDSSHLESTPWTLGRVIIPASALKPEDYGKTWRLSTPTELDRRDFLDTQANSRLIELLEHYSEGTQWPREDQDTLLDTMNQITSRPWESYPNYTSGSDILLEAKALTMAMFELERQGDIAENQPLPGFDRYLTYAYEYAEKLCKSAYRPDGVEEQLDTDQQGPESNRESDVDPYSDVEDTVEAIPPSQTLLSSLALSERELHDGLP